jgi:lipid-A-disaccharide synthase
MRELHYFIIAGENSGDLHGANLVRAMKARYPKIRFAGLGGRQMRSVGVDLLSNIVKELAIIGLAGVLQNLPRIRKLFNRTTEYLRDHRPDAIILVDYPGFNIRIADQAKKLGIPVIWYISPQIWAWHGSRKYTLAKLVTKMIVIFPFEKAIYSELKMDVDYVGHPLFDVIHIDQTKEEVFAEFDLDPARPLITIVPGSREKEVASFLAIMLDGARRFKEEHPRTQFVIVRATTIDKAQIKEIHPQGRAAVRHPRHRPEALQPARALRFLVGQERHVDAGGGHPRRPDVDRVPHECRDVCGGEGTLHDQLYRPAEHRGAEPHRARIAPR